MKSLFNATDNKEMVERINSLTASTQAKWGKMDVAQMCKHCQVPLQGMFGEVTLKRGLIGILFGKMAKKSLITDNKPFKQNLPTDKLFIVTDKKVFEEEKAKLVAIVKSIVEKGKSKVTKDAHPFFGPMNSEEWDILQWKHLDHHLTQFGA